MPQLNVLNEDYAPSGIQFDLIDVSRTQNDAYFNDEAEVDMKANLRQGGYSALNIYFQNLQGDLLGYCYCDSHTDHHRVTKLNFHSPRSQS
jgi:hypothetical protein